MYQAESTDELSKKRHLIHYRSEKKSKEVISLYYLTLTQSLDQIFNTVLKGVIFILCHLIVDDGAFLLEDLVV